MTSEKNKISIIIPAHNEEKVIGNTLSHLYPGVESGDLEIIVVCNGCSDNTVGIVNSFGQSIFCIETPIASKPHALNIGEEAAKWFPRIYQDADVVLSVRTVDRIARILRKGPYLTAAPKMQMEYHNASWAVKSYYEIWQSLPYVREGVIGVGVYALSEEGRKRFDIFPDIIADDGYIRALFKSYERILIDDCYSLVRAPEDLRGLIKIKTRSRRGGYELARKFPELMQNEEKNYGSAVLSLMKSLDLWPKIPIYLFVNMISRLIARKQSLKKNNSVWERDESSRNSSNLIK